MSFYPSPTDRRLAWDIDGTILVARSDEGSITSSPSQWQMTAMNSETTASWNPPDWGLETWGYISFVFPDYRDVSGIFVNSDGWHIGGDRAGAVEVSADTTNGLDGIWTQVVADLPNYDTVKTWRVNYTTFTPQLDVLGIRFRRMRYIAGTGNTHIYGKAGSLANTKRLKLYQSTGWEIDKVTDYGDVERDHTDIRQFRIRNYSNTHSAYGVVVSMESLTGVSEDWYSFSLDGVDYLSSLDVGDLTTQTETTFYLKQILPGGSAIGPASSRMRAEASSWVEIP